MNFNAVRRPSGGINPTRTLITRFVSSTPSTYHLQTSGISVPSFVTPSHCHPSQTRRSLSSSSSLFKNKFRLQPLYLPPDASPLKKKPKPYKAKDELKYRKDPNYRGAFHADEEAGINIDPDSTRGKGKGHNAVVYRQDVKVAKHLSRTDMDSREDYLNTEQDGGDGYVSSKLSERLRWIDDLTDRGGEDYKEGFGLRRTPAGQGEPASSYTRVPSGRRLPDFASTPESTPETTSTSTSTSSLTPAPEPVLPRNGTSRSAFSEYYNASTSSLDTPWANSGSGHSSPSSGRHESADTTAFKVRELMREDSERFSRRKEREMREVERGKREVERMDRFPARRDQEALRFANKMLARQNSASSRNKSLNRNMGNNDIRDKNNYENPNESPNTSPTPTPTAFGRKPPTKSTWEPKKKLSLPAMQGLKELHAKDPVMFSVPVLSEKFGISYDAVNRILRSRFRESQAAGGGGPGVEGKEGREE